MRNLRELIAKYEVSTLEISKATKWDGSRVKRHLDNPFFEMRFCDVVKLYSEILRKKGVGFDEYIKSIVGTKYKGSQRKWFELDKDEYE